MDTREITEEYRLGYWAQVIREQKESGQTIKEYCMKEGVNQHAYYYWQKKLRKVAYKKMTELQMAQNQTAIDMPRFAEIKIGQVHPQLPKPGTIQPSHIHLEVGGMHITFDSSYPPCQLAELLKALVGQC